MKNNIYAVLLAGGKGTRLWPLSREGSSKSFIRIGNRNPLVVDCINRLRGFVEKENIIIVVDKSQEKSLRKLAKGIPGKNILVEPFGRSTASAIGLAAIALKESDIMAVFPTDALIKGPRRFRKTLKDAVGFAYSENTLLCVGIKPDRPSTSYGYIKIKSPEGRGIYSVDKFVEKPNEKKAEEFIKNKAFLWNAGIFVFKAGDILLAMKKYSPELYKELLRMKKNIKVKESAYRRMKNVSIDYQIMEKARNLYCAKGNFSWSDLGNWRSVSELLRKDRHGNAVFGKAELLNTRDSIVYNSTKDKLGIVGLRDTIVVRTKAGMLVSSKKDAEKVKVLAERLG